MIGMKHVVVVSLAVVMLSACTVTARSHKPVPPRVVVEVDDHHHDHRHDHRHDDDYYYDDDHGHWHPVDGRRDHRKGRFCPPGHAKKGWCGRFR